MTKTVYLNKCFLVYFCLWKNQFFKHADPPIFSDNRPYCSFLRQGNGFCLLRNIFDICYSLFIIFYIVEFVGGWHTLLNMPSWLAKERAIRATSSLVGVIAPLRLCSAIIKADQTSTVFSLLLPFATLAWKEKGLIFIENKTIEHLPICEYSLLDNLIVNDNWIPPQQTDLHPQQK